MPDGSAGVSPKRRRGGQTKYTEEIAEEICERLAQGESLNAVCKDPHMPSEFTVRQWVLDDQADGGGLGRGFASKYARARQIAYDLMAEEILAISDADCTFDGKPDNALVQQARLRSDNRKWFLSKVLPKKYGDRVTAEVVGDANAPLVTRIELVAVPAVHRVIGPVIDAGCDDGDDRSSHSKPAETLD